MSLISKAFAFMTNGSPAKADTAPEDAFNDDIVNNNTLPVQANTNMSSQDVRKPEIIGESSRRVTRQSQVKLSQLDKRQTRSSDSKRSLTTSDTGKIMLKPNKLPTKSNKRSPNQKILTDFFKTQNKNDGKKLGSPKQNPEEDTPYKMAKSYAENSAHARCKADPNKKVENSRDKGAHRQEMLINKDDVKRGKSKKVKQSPSSSASAAIIPSTKASKKLTKSAPCTPTTGDCCSRRTRSTPVTPIPDISSNPSDVQRSKHPLYGKSARDPSMATGAHRTRSKSNTYTCDLNKENMKVNQKPAVKKKENVDPLANVSEQPTSRSSKYSTQSLPGPPFENLLYQKARRLPSTPEAGRETVGKKENVPNEAEKEADNTSRKLTRCLSSENTNSRTTRSTPGTPTMNSCAIEKNVDPMKNAMEKPISPTNYPTSLTAALSESFCTRKTRSMPTTPTCSQLTDNKTNKNKTLTPLLGTGSKERKVPPRKSKMNSPSIDVPEKNPANCGLVKNSTQSVLLTPSSHSHITRSVSSDPTNNKNSETSAVTTPKDKKLHRNESATKIDQGKSKKTPNIDESSVNNSTISESPIPTSLLASFKSGSSSSVKAANTSSQSGIPVIKKRGRPIKNAKSPENINSSPFEKKVDGNSVSGSKGDCKVNSDHSVTAAEKTMVAENNKNNVKPNVSKSNTASFKAKDNVTSSATAQKVSSEQTKRKRGRPFKNKQSGCTPNIAKSNADTIASKDCTAKDTYSEMLLSEQSDSPMKKKRGRPSIKKEVSTLRFGSSARTAAPAKSNVCSNKKLPVKHASLSPRRTRSTIDTPSTNDLYVTQSSRYDPQSSLTVTQSSQNETTRSNVNVTQCESHTTEDNDVTPSTSHSNEEMAVTPSSSHNDIEEPITSSISHPSTEMSVTQVSGSPVSVMGQTMPQSLESHVISRYREDGNDVTMAEISSTDSDECVVPTCTRKELQKDPEESMKPQVAPDITNDDIDEEACITDTMEAEEKKIHQQLVKQDKKEHKQEVKEWTDMQETHRFSRLQHLLDKSSIYTKFLLTQMEKQREQNEKREKRIAKRQENKDMKEAAKANQVIRKSSRRKENEQNEDQDAQSVPKGELKTKRGRKRKANPKLSDYITEEALKKRQKLSEQKSPVKSPLTNTAENTVGSPDQCVPGTPKSTPDTPKVQKTSDGTKHTDASPKDDESLEQPSLVTGGTLRLYQMEGLNWLKILYENGVNGILADEMGLGKTIQCISLVAHLIENGVKGPFLIAAPLSTLPNWISEFHRFTPKIPVILYHGSKDERTRLRHKIDRVIKVDSFVTQPVVVTSYEICMNDQKFLYDLPWKHLIVDEGHRIKNLNCRLIKELKTYKTCNRLLLTGTPLQNNLQELWSLLNFLLPDIFDELSSFQMLFDFEALEDKEGREKILAQEKEHQVLERLHAILTPFLLRRLKADVELSLPPKKELLVYAPLTAKQTEFYKAALDKSILNIVGSNKDEKPEAVELTPSGRPKRKTRVNIDYTIFDTDDIDQFSKSMSTLNNMRQSGKSANKQQQDYEVNVPIMNILMVLRKCCNHPYLLEYPLNPLTGQFKVDEALIKSSGKMMILDQLLQGLKERGHKVLIFSQMTKMLDIIEDYCYYKKFKFCRLDGSIKFEERREQIHDFNTHPEVFIFLLSTRAGGLGLNLSAADTVIIFDSDWNPQADLQAQDRCHRIGQTKPILVYRLVTANTVDQKMFERAASKRKLEKLVIHKGKFKGKIDSNAISAEELKDLLESAHIDHVVSNDGFTLNTKQLNALLDRSDLINQQKQNVNAIKDSNTDSTLFRIVEDDKET